MNVVIFKENDRVSTYNPSFVAYTEMVPGFNKEKWCVNLHLLDGTMKNRIYDSQKEAQEYVDYVSKCILPEK